MAQQKIAIHFKGKTFAVRPGKNLRKALLKQELSPYNGSARHLNCRGMGTCGTCAVKIQGAVSAPTAVEKWRLNFPPHNTENSLRLACQCSVQGELRIEKWAGFWGHIPARKD